MTEAERIVLNEQVTALKNAASAMAAHALITYRREQPERAAELASLLDQGLVEIGTTVHLTPRLCAEVWGITPDGTRHVFATVQATATGGASWLN